MKFGSKLRNHSSTSLGTQRRTREFHKHCGLRNRNRQDLNWYICNQEESEKFFEDNNSSVDRGIIDKQHKKRERDRVVSAASTESVAI